MAKRDGSFAANDPAHMGCHISSSRTGSGPSSDPTIPTSPPSLMMSSVSTHEPATPRGGGAPSTRKARSRQLDRTQWPGLSAERSGGNAQPSRTIYKRHWHDDPVRRAQRARRQGHRPLRAAPSASGVHPLHRNRRAGPRAEARQRVIHAILDNYAAHKHPQVLAWLAEHPRWTFHSHADLLLLAQYLPWKASFSQAHSGRASRAGRFSLGRRPRKRDHPLHRRDQQEPQALPLDRDHKNHPGQAHTEPSV